MKNVCEVKELGNKLFFICNNSWADFKYIMKLYIFEEFLIIFWSEKI